MPEKNKKILCIDDNEMLTTMMVGMLTKRGFDVVGVSDSTQAEGVLYGDNFDMVLSDIEMPGLSGLELLKKIRKKYEQIELPVIMITGKSDDDSLVEAMAAGANDYITKPVNFNIALARIMAHLQLSDLSRQITMVKRQEAISAMVVTYNHEINNQLAVAKGYLTLAMKTIDKQDLREVDKALDMISEIVHQIKDVAGSGGMNLTNYVNSEKGMVSLDKRRN